jgi:ribosomal-protein-alanine N-acetyltransferase
VLRRNAFTEIGVARKHLLIGGRWRDHLLFERLADD